MAKSAEVVAHCLSVCLSRGQNRKPFAGGGWSFVWGPWRNDDEVVKSQERQRAPHWGQADRGIFRLKLRSREGGKERKSVLLRLKEAVYFSAWTNKAFASQVRSWDR